MDAVQLTVVLWGFACGLAIIPSTLFAFHVTRPRREFDRFNARAALNSIFSALVAGAAFTFLMIGSGHLLGLIPLRANGPLFGLSFLAGALVMRIAIDIRRKRQERNFD